MAVVDPEVEAGAAARRPDKKPLQKQLQPCREDDARIKARIREVGFICEGSLVERWTRCRYVAFTGAAPGLVPDDTNVSYDVFVHGPELTLEAEPESVSAGQVATLAMDKGVPGRPALLWLVRVNGTRTLTLLDIGTLAGDGNFVVSGTVAPGLSGETITVRGYAVGQMGVPVRTNDVTVSFQ